MAGLAIGSSQFIPHMSFWTTWAATEGLFTLSDMSVCILDNHLPFQTKSLKMRVTAERPSNGKWNAQLYGDALHVIR